MPLSGTAGEGTEDGRFSTKGRCVWQIWRSWAGFSVNGVAKLHTEILKKQELRDFYEMMPEKFNNKTNGITQRRFLLHGNPLLAQWVTDHIGDGWITNLPEIKKIEPLADDPECRRQFREIKYQNKLRLAEYIQANTIDIEVNPESIFDVQVKRLHEYKRQLLNILHVMYLYNQLKDQSGDGIWYPVPLSLARKRRPVTGSRSLPSS